jgi:hypothetical protein
MAVDVGTADGARAGPGDQQHLQLTQDRLLHRARGSGRIWHRGRFASDFAQSLNAMSVSERQEAIYAYGQRMGRCCLSPDPPLILCSAGA